MRHGARLHFGRMSPVALAAGAAILIVVLAGARASGSAHSASSSVQTQQSAQTTTGNCTRATCTFTLKVNPALLSGTFACPAIKNAEASITVTNRFATGADNDVMTLRAEGLPKNTGFALFLIQNTPLDSGTFSGFGFGWYQSDMTSDGEGDASVRVQGIFDKETFIENPADPFTPIHTFNVGFWFADPVEQKRVCGNATTPATTPFDGDLVAGSNAMITKGEPLGLIR